MQKEITCCFTGHRSIKESPSLLQNELERSICSLIDAGFVNFESGGALGFDTLAAQTVLKLKKTHPHIRLSMVLPCRDQDRFWSEPQRAVYHELITHADETVYTADTYHRGCMLKRNRFLVDSASCVLAYLERKSGGTKYTVDYANKTGVEVLFLRPQEVPRQLTFFS